ncbi:BAG domain-containing protein [Mycena venus]|uniref:BAG domain-containing protein n=1 Tax=Mycena venus TaxID=2733690 RepID=A0A8H6YNT9_9AGAR|nr:BAG domain-containing protein [Mycena venus]
MVHLKWNSERFTFDVPPPDTPLSVIRTSVAEFTSLPRDAFKLIHKGAVMKDDNAPISAYHIRQSSTIAVVEIGPPPQPQQAPPAQTAPKAKGSRTHHLLASAAGEPKEHIRLSELLLQSLLRLDAIQTDGEWDAARRERKAAVKEVQALLDRLDGNGS